MPHSMTRRWLLAPALMLLSTAAACTQPAAPLPSAGTPQAPREEKVEMELGPGGYDLPDPLTGLSGLSSYRATLTVSFVGKRAGQAVEWSREYEMQFTNEPAARRWTVQSTEDSAADQRVGLAEARGAEYEIFGDGTCVARVQDRLNSRVAALEPAGDLRALRGIEAAGRETVAGIEADHYTFDERALLQAGKTDSSGELWFVPQGGYVLRYVETTTAGDKFFGEDTEGTMKWEYQLTDIDAAAPVEVPPGCPPGLVEAPVMADAANIQSDPGLMQYESASGVADVAAFYQEQLPALGWVDPAGVNAPAGVDPAEFQQIMEMAQALGLNQPVPETAPGDEQMLIFDREGERLIVTITVEGSATKVVLSLSSAPG